MANDDNCSAKKLTLSYVHNASSHHFVYGTIAQSFDELTKQYPDDECYVFKGIYSKHSNILLLIIFISRGRQEIHLRNIKA
jgi:hypothetical protein